MVRPDGLEPPTRGLGNRCSILLSYGRASLIKIIMAERVGFEPTKQV
jgi:hypothetical protein